MGAGASVTTDANGAMRLQTPSRIVAAFLNLANKPHHAPLVAAKTQWKIAQPFAGANGEPSTNEQELLHMLHDPVGQKHIGAFAKKILTSETFFCWVEIKEFREAPSIGYRKSMAKLIYRKYIKNGSTMALGSITSDLIALYDKKIAELEASHGSSATVDFFDPLMTNIVADMCQNTFMRFKASSEYETFKKDLKDTYNKVTIEDFEYLELLGSGGFGRVVHARKKSTGKHYAMKIQLKTGLLDEHHDQLSQITSEKDILQICHNPFVLDMHYSFQTPAHAIIVTELPKLTRRKTTVGTRGYMAPEIISGKLVKRDQRPGYTFAVDFWSLGITIFELMCGFQPFSMHSSGNFFQEVANEEIFRLSPRTQHKIELQKMAQGVTFPLHLTRNAQDFLKRLLEVSPEHRLGCNVEKGFAEFMEHPFFETVDWEKLMMKHIDPKFKPALPLLTDKKIYNSYEHMMSHFDMRDKDFIRHDWYADPDPEMQKHFDTWDYISQYTLRAELGIAKELDETNIPYKVLQLTGEDSKAKFTSPK
ncbi:hypothetical protein PF002_g3236 [Phytophthora fragariae]|uniref:Protein kinase domain-containing protein n=1 Tax=Phytophthora fragariae TaxID=53985 RepID=A0A6A4AAU6_9STRA|nr:hypothetical protein PF002_g3236 [Phytophthora fragariae]KAE9326318.1 hypothetical protein PF001_g2490 [Phytophthora fragariae]